jgi:Protein of unknown function (DUF2785)
MLPLPVLLVCAACATCVLLPIASRPVQASATQTSAAAHDKAFWQAIVKADYAVPPNEQLMPLARELSAMLASPDPELRDEFGYSILAAWIFQKRLIEPAPLRELIAGWTKNLESGIGSTDTDAVFLRSFSALMLSVAVARDNAAPYLDAVEVQSLLAATLGYLAKEKDVRGYDAKTGWMHSAAHTADLVKFLARSRHLPASGQREILDAIGDKMRAAPVVYTFGEDQRFARAVLSIVNRADFDREGFDAWVGRVTPVWPKTPRPDAAVVRVNQNLTNLLSKLHVVLSSQPATPAGEGLKAAQERVATAVKTLF